MKTNTQNKVGKRLIVSIVVLALLLVSFLTVFSSLVNASFTTVAIDVNPSLELEVSSSNKVLAVKTNNEDAVIILGTMNLEGVDLDIAVNALIGAMVSNGYLDEVKNSVLLSVKGNDVERENELKTQLTQSINNALSGTTITGSVIAQTMLENNDIDDIIEALGISKAKASIIEKIIKLDARLIAEELAVSSINDLNLLLQSKNLLLDGVEMTGQASSLSYISSIEAINIAVSQSGLIIGDILKTKVEFDVEDGVMVYEVKLKTETTKFKYEINATSGEVVAFETELNDNDEEEQDALPENSITEDEALLLALAHAGINEADVLEFEVEYEHEDSVHIYEVEFDTLTTEYEYEINAETGTIVSFDQENEEADEIDEEDEINEVDEEEQDYESEVVLKTEVEVKAVAFANAGVEEINATNIEIDLTEMYDISQYLITFTADVEGISTDFVYIINAVTGLIISPAVE